MTGPHAVQTIHVTYRSFSTGEILNVEINGEALIADAYKVEVHEEAPGARDAFDAQLALQDPLTRMHALMRVEVTLYYHVVKKGSGLVSALWGGEDGPISLKLGPFAFYPEEYRAEELDIPEGVPGLTP